MPETRRELSLAAIPAGVTSLLHLLTANDSYGLFRDELYYLACADHLDFGYVDQPPLVAVLAWLVRSLLGESMLALRLLPALAAGATVLLASLMARELGGDRLAQTLAAVAAALAPVYVGTFGFLSMNAFDVLLWAGATLILIRMFRTGDLRWWPAFGLVAGIGLENKLSIVFLGLGLVIGLLLAREWRHFSSPRFWLAGLIAFTLFLPHLVWQALHDWPTLEFMTNATQYKNLPLSPADFLGAQVTMMNPVALPLFLAGLAFYLLSGEGRSYRPLGWTFLAVTLLMITQRSKAYYLSPIYTMMFAAGAVIISRWTARRGWTWIRPAYPTLLVFAGLLLAPLAKPVLPVEQYVAYAARLGQEPQTSERKEVGRLPQFFADRLGWPELAVTVAEVHRALPPEDRARVCIFGQNYGQAGAIDFYGAALGLPHALSGHNSYYLWGPGNCTGEVMLVISDNRERLDELFEKVELGAVYTCQDCMPYENNKPIWICRGLRRSLAQLWPEVKSYG